MNPAVWIFLGLILFWIGVYYWTRRERSTRVNTLSNAALPLGWQPASHLADSLVERCKEFPHFRRRKSFGARDVFTLPLQHSTATLFEHVFRSGSHANNAAADMETVVLLEFADKQFPSFTIRPEGFHDKIFEVFGMTDIDFSEYPAFSKSYLLKAENEQAVRDFFTGQLIELFENNKGLRVESHENQMVVLLPRERIAAKELSNLTSRVSELARCVSGINSSAAARAS